MTTLPHVRKMDKEFGRSGNQTNAISFPLGGIGAGCIGLAGNGRLVDFEIFNRPNKNTFNGFSFFAIRAERDGQVIDAKILQGDLHPPYSGVDQKDFKYMGFGFGVPRETMAGLPHFQDTQFRGEFPFAEIAFEDAHSPYEVKLKAFSPFIPLNDRDSSIPTAIFTYEVTNRTTEDLDITIAGNMTNPHVQGAFNQFTQTPNWSGVRMYSSTVGANDAKYGDLVLSTDGEEISYQSNWYRGGWFDNLTVFWKDFITPGKFQDRSYAEPRSEYAAAFQSLDACLLANHQTISPGESATFRFVVTWHYPNFVNYWNPGEHIDKNQPHVFPSWKNYYATLFTDASDVADYVWTNVNRLQDESLRFKDALLRSTLPDVVLDAISSTISVLISPTCVRLTDGTLYGFEGLHSDVGCCEGSCTHVWNYEQTTAFLFPALARSMRDIDYRYAQHQNGMMSFRLYLPPERTIIENTHRAAVDGQMGGIFKVYREWKISGDTAWLTSLWPNVKKALEFAWEPTNPDLWDADQDGVMEGRQHHTLDMELFGPNSWLSGYYLTALKAASEMARYLGEIDKAEEYNTLFERGKTWVNAHLFNGEYFHQKVDPRDKALLEKFGAEDVYWNDEDSEMKYQVGEGCEIDQVIGQWYAHVAGLGYILDPIKVKSALRHLFQYNFVSEFRNYANTCRIYAVNDDKGLVIATWPKGNSPRIPIPYQDETQNGYEYQAACHMLYEGLIDEGLSVVKAIRDRYNGENRNPWNEFECGNNYARSMASYSLLLALSGFEYDMVEGKIGFNPKINREQFRCFWSLNKGWGEVYADSNNITFSVLYGEIQLNVFTSDLLAQRIITGITLAEVSIPYEISEQILRFKKPITVQAGDTLIISTQSC